MRDTLPALLELTLSRMRQFFRDPGAIFWTFGFPLMLGSVLAFAFRTAPAPKLQLSLVCESDCTRVRAALASSEELVTRETSREEAAAALRRSKADLVLEVLADGALLHRFDPTRPEGRAARMAAQLALEPNPDPNFRAREERAAVPGARYIDFLLPGLLGVNLMSSSVWGISFSIVEARRRKLLKQLSATPLRRRDFMGAVMLGRLAFVAFEVVAILGFGTFVLDVPLRGALTSVVLLSLLGAIAFTGLALLVSSRVATIEAVSGWGNVVILPMWLLSGVFFHYERFPEPLWPWLRCLPLTALNAGLRAIINDGRPLLGLGSELLVLFAWSLLSYAIALRVFRWQ